MGAGNADIAEVVAGVLERLPGLPRAPQLDPEQARYRLFDSIAEFSKTASQRQPLVLALGRPAVLNVAPVCARGLGGARLLIIGTYRDTESGRRTIGDSVS